MKDVFIVESKEDKLKFINWYVNSTIEEKEKEGIYQGDIDSIRSYAEGIVNEFIKLKPRIKSPYNDFYYWIKNASAMDLDKYLDGLHKEIDSKEKVKSKEQEGARLVYSDKDWKVYEISTYEASAKYGKGTKWCIAGSKRWTNGEHGSEYFDDYHNQKGITFYYFIHGDDKWALAVYPENKYCEIFNAEDVKVAYIPNAPKIDEIKVDYRNNSDANILVNAIMSGKIDEDVLIPIMEETIYNETGASTSIFPNISSFISSVDEWIPDGYIEHEACSNNIITPEEYEDITGEAYNEYWDGDLPMVEYESIDMKKNPFDCKTKKELLSRDNIKPHRYWLCVDSDVGWGYEVDGIDDFVQLYLVCDDYCGITNWQDYDIEEFYKNVGAKTGGSRADIFALMISDTLINDIKKHEVSKSVLDGLGLSDEFMASLGENINSGAKVAKNGLKEELTKEQEEFFKDSRIKDKSGNLIPMWHGTNVIFQEFARPINWFSVSKDYAKDFSKWLGGTPVLYEAYLNCKKPFNCGNTNVKVFDMIPSNPLKLSRESEAICRKLDIDEHDFRRLVAFTSAGDDIKEQYKLDLHTIIRLGEFANFVKSKGYDSIVTIEDGHICVGVFNPSDIKRVTNLKPTNSNNIDEELKEFEFTLDDVKKYLENDLKYAKKLTSPDSDGPMVVLDDGSIYDISSYEIHSYFAGALASHLGYDEFDFDDFDSDAIDYMQDVLGIITLNPGNHAFEDRLKIVCAQRPTNAQCDAMRDFIDISQANFPPNTELYVWAGHSPQVYPLSKYTSDEIVKKIRLAFVRGRLEEAKAITWGDLDFAKKTDTRGIQMSGRGTGHFGTGFYFVGANGPYGINGDKFYDYEPSRPIYEIDLDAYKLFKPKDNETAYKIHDSMREINNCYEPSLDAWLDKELDIDELEDELFQIGWDADSIEEDLEDEFDDLDLDIDDLDVPDKDLGNDELTDEDKDRIYDENYRRLVKEFIKKYGLENYVWADLDHDKIGKIENNVKDGIHRKYSDLQGVKYAINLLSKEFNVEKDTIIDIIKKAYANKDSVDTISTQIFKALGYEGVDVTHLNHDAQGLSGLDNFSYGTVIYDLKPGTFRKIMEPRKDKSGHYKAGEGLEEDFTEEDVIALVMNELGTSDRPIDGPSYIMPDGSFLTIWKSGIPVSKYSATGSATHRDVQDFLHDKGIVKDKGIDVDTPELEHLGCIRVNSGFEEYIWLPDRRPNDAQWKSLLMWMDWYFRFHIKLLVGFKNTAPKTYFSKDYTTDEILKKCKEAYGIGYLNEKIVKKGNKWQVQSEKGRNLGTYDTKEEAEDRLKQVHYFKHKNTIEEGRKSKEQLIKDNFESKNPGEGCIYITKEGTFINLYPEIDSHEDLCYWLEDEFDFELPYEDEEWAIRQFGWVRCRETPIDVNVIELPKEITQEQISAIDNWLNNVVSYNELEIGIVDNNQIQRYDLEEYSPNDILNRIKGFYSTGILKENYFKHMNESYKILDRDSNTILYTTTDEMISFLRNTNLTEVRALYDSEHGWYIVANPDKVIHAQMVAEALNSGIYDAYIEANQLEQVEGLLEYRLINYDCEDEEDFNDYVEPIFEPFYLIKDIGYYNDVSYHYAGDIRIDDDTWKVYAINYVKNIIPLIKETNSEENILSSNNINENLDERYIYYRGYDSRYGVFDSNNEYGQLYTWVTDEPEYALEYAEENKYGKVAKVRITCSDDEIGGVLDLPEDVDYYDPGDEEFQECILDQGLKGYGFEAGDYDDYCICISKNCVEVIDPDVKVEVEDESLNESKQDIEKFRQWAGDELADRFFKLKDRLPDRTKDIYHWISTEKQLLKLKDRYKDAQGRSIISNYEQWAHEQAINGLKLALDNVEQTPTRREVNKLGKEGSEKIYEDENWLVLKINTYEASVKYGKGTEWCITGNNSDQGRVDFNNHTQDSNATIYFFINKKNKLHKYALEYVNDNDWCLFDETDFPHVGYGTSFERGVNSMGGEHWYKGDNKETFPTIKGLPDINKAYDDFESMDESLKEDINKYYRLEIEDAFGDRSGLITGSFELIPTRDTIEEYPEDFVDLTDDERRRYYRFDLLLNELCKIKSPGVDANLGTLRSSDIFAFTSNKYNEIKPIIEEMSQLLKEMGFKLIVKELDIDDEDISYRDDDQVAFSKSNSVKYINESKADWERFKQWCGDEELYNKFVSLKQRLSNIEFEDGFKGDDIYFWMKHATPQDLEDTLQGIEDTPTKKERDKKAQEGAKLLYNKDGWKVYEITSYEASCKYGKGTTWCISGENGYEGQEYFNDYYGNGDRIIFFIHEDDKYALIIPSSGDYLIWNEEDNRIAYIPNAPYIEGLPDVSKFNERILDEILKLYKISPSDIIDIQDALDDDELIDFFIDYDTREAYKVETKNGTFYCIYNYPKYEDVTKDLEQWVKEYM